MIIKFLSHIDVENWIKQQESIPDEIRRNTDNNIYVDWDNNTIYTDKDADKKRREILDRRQK